MKMIVVAVVALTTAGCEQRPGWADRKRSETGHYAVAAAADGGAYRLNTRTGALQYCRRDATSGELACGMASDVLRKPK